MLHPHLIPQPEAASTLLDVSPFDDDHAILADILQHSTWTVAVSRTCAEATAFLKRRSVPVVICECTLPDGNWRDILERTERAVRPPSLIVVSRLADDRLWAEVLNRGGYNVMMKPFHPREVLHDVGFAWQQWKAQQEQAAAAAAKPRVAGGGAC